MKFKSQRIIFTIFLISALSFGIAACSPQPADIGDQGFNIVHLDEPPTSVPTDSIQGLFARYPCLPHDHKVEQAVTVRNIDPFTILVNANGEEKRVQLIGIKPADRSASNFNQPLMPNVNPNAGEEIIIIYGIGASNTLSTEKAYVFSNGEFINMQLVAEVYGVPDPEQSDSECFNYFVKAEPPMSLVPGAGS